MCTVTVAICRKMFIAILEPLCDHQPIERFHSRWFNELKKVFAYSLGVSLVRQYGHCSLFGTPIWPQWRHRSPVMVLPHPFLSQLTRDWIVSNVACPTTSWSWWATTGFIMTRRVNMKSVQDLTSPKHFSLNWNAFQIGPPSNVAVLWCQPMCRLCKVKSALLYFCRFLTRPILMTTANCLSLNLNTWYRRPRTSSSKSRFKSCVISVTMVSNVTCSLFWRLNFTNWCSMTVDEKLIRFTYSFLLMVCAEIRQSI